MEGVTTENTELNTRLGIGTGADKRAGACAAGAGACAAGAGACAGAGADERTGVGAGALPSAHTSCMTRRIIQVCNNYK